jgi:hypothetical protein
MTMSAMVAVAAVTVATSVTAGHRRSRHHQRCDRNGDNKRQFS